LRDGLRGFPFEKMGEGHVLAVDVGDEGKGMEPSSQQGIWSERRNDSELFGLGGGVTGTSSDELSVSSSSRKWNTAFWGTYVRRGILRGLRDAAPPGTRVGRRPGEISETRTGSE
jgi:hypothetical protein